MIVVTAPTAKIGSQVLARLVESGEPVRVVARDPAKLAPGIRERVEVVQGSHSEADVVNEAFAGADAVFWLVPADRWAPSIDAAYTGFARAGIEAFAKHGVRHVVGISALGRGTLIAGHAGNVTATLAMDDSIAASGVHYRALASASFMDNTLRDLPSIKTRGHFATPIEVDRRLPTVATRDIAAVAAGLLRNREWSGVREIALLGPEDLSPTEMAAIISEELGIRVGCRQISGQELKAGLTGLMSEPIAQAVVDMALAKNAGLDSGAARTAQHGTPTTFRAWCREVLKPAYEADTGS